MSGLRIVVLAISTVLFLLGVAAVLGAGGNPDAISGGWTTIVVFGAIAILVVLERQRYRSTAAEHAGLAPGPGGGEAPNDRLDGRFRATDEVFIDPPSGRRMRVWSDPGTGERRYRAEG